MATCAIDGAATEPTKEDPYCTNGNYESCPIFMRGPKPVRAVDPYKMHRL